MRSIKDNFKAFLIDGATLCGSAGLPMIVQNGVKIPDELIGYDSISKATDRSQKMVHFYIDRSLYDSFNGIWNNLSPEELNKFEELDGFLGVIAPDYEVRFDMPAIEAMYNIYRSRAIGYYLTTLGYYVIPDVKWTNSNSYEYAFKGLIEGSVIAVRIPSDDELPREYFYRGLNTLIGRIKPTCIIFKGELNSKMKSFLEFLNQDYREFN